MTDPAPQRTVFISYRRAVSSYLSLSLFAALRARGFDVFRDFDLDDPDEQSSLVFGQVRARAHFILLLAPGTLHGCERPGDWLRRLVDEATRLNRHIIPVLIDGFQLADAKDYIRTPALSALATYPPKHLHGELDATAVDHLVAEFLQSSTAVPLLPVEPGDDARAQGVVAAMASLPPPTPDQLKAERYFHRGISKQDAEDYAGAIEDYAAAIYLNPVFAEAYSNRGAARFNTRDGRGALDDFNEAIRLNPDFSPAYTNRATLRAMTGDLDGSLRDLTDAIRLDADNDSAYTTRASVRRAVGNLDGALADSNEAIRLNPENAGALSSRALTRMERGELDGAIADFTAAIQLEPEYASAFNNRGEARFIIGDYEAAHADFKQSLFLEPSSPVAFAGWALAEHALGNVHDARRMWRQLVAQDARFADADWVAEFVSWADALRDEARKVVAGL